MESTNKGYATVLFIRSDSEGKQILLQKKDRGYKSYPDYWTVFGGHIKPDETALNCITREVNEELGLTYPSEAFKLFSEILINRDDGSVPLNLYTADFSSDISEIRIGEGCGFAFWYLDEVSSLKLIPHEVPLINGVIDSLKN